MTISELEDRVKKDTVTKGEKILLEAKKNRWKKIEREAICVFMKVLSLKSL